MIHDSCSSNQAQKALAASSFITFLENNENIPFLLLSKQLFFVLSPVSPLYYKASGKAHTPMVARIQRLFLWESSRDSGWEGVPFHNLTLSVGFDATSPQGRGIFIIPIITQIGRENNISAEIYVSRTVEDAGPYNLQTSLWERS